MASKVWTAVDAAMELLNPKNIKSESVIDIGSRFPLFTKSVLQDGTQALLNILTGIPEVTAEEIEKNLRGKKAASKSANEKGQKGTGRKTSGKKEEVEEEDEEENPYEGKSAKELYTLCKERGLKVKTKQPASEYAKILMEADEAQDEEDAEDEDWEEEEEDQEEKKPPKKKAGRPAKKKEPESEEDDDDWEL